jgi:hypothetical protein
VLTLLALACIPLALSLRNAKLGGAAPAGHRAACLQNRQIGSRGYLSMLATGNGFEQQKPVEFALVRIR